MNPLEYFQTDEPVTAEEHAFLTALHRRIEGRIHPWCGRQGTLESQPLLVGLDIDAPKMALLTMAVCVRDGRLRGDRIDIVDWDFPEAPSTLAVEAHGTPDALADVAAAWLERLLNLRIVLHEWFHRGWVYATRYVLVDTGETLAQSYASVFAPPGQPDQLIRDGFVYGMGWIQTAGLGPPDRETTVRP